MLEITDEVKMPFGAYKSSELKNVPTELLEYYSQWDDLKEPIKSHIISQLAVRKKISLSENDIKE